MARWKTVALLGVGLIGGSIGMALRGRGLAERVVGIGRRRVSLEAALAAEAVTEVTESLAEGVRDAELIVVCTPVELIPGQVQECRQYCPGDALLTDAGSTKGAIVEQIERTSKSTDAGVFIGSHPLAGSDRSGVQHARGDLLDGRVVVVTPVESTAAEPLERLEAFWQSLGARTRRMSPRDHDEALAVTSHLPHVVAAALAATTSSDVLDLTATGWADTTRIAAANPELWQQILLSNQPHALRALDNFGKVLADFRTALEQADSEALTKLLQTGKNRRDVVGN